MALSIKTDDALPLSEECNSGHALDGDLADLNLGIRLTMTLTLVIALLGLVLVDTDLLALAVLNDSGSTFAPSTTGVPNLVFSPSTIAKT